MSKINKLQLLKSSDIALFTLKNREALGKVVNIFSANICQIILGLNNVIFKFNCKLKNTIEHKKSNIEDTLKIVSDSENISDNQEIIKIVCYDFDTDGNLLVDLFKQDDTPTSINKLLILSGNLQEYDHDSHKLFKFSLYN